MHTEQRGNDWAGIEMANALGPFGQLQLIRRVVSDYPAPGNPAYRYFIGFLRGRDSAYRPPDTMTVHDHIAHLDTLSQKAALPCLKEDAAGFRDGLRVQFDYFN